MLQTVACLLLRELDALPGLLATPWYGLFHDGLVTVERKICKVQSACPLHADDDLGARLHILSAEGRLSRLLLHLVWCLGILGDLIRHLDVVDEYLLRL